MLSWLFIAPKNNSKSSDINCPSSLCVYLRTLLLASNTDFAVTSVGEICSTGVEAGLSTLSPLVLYSHYQFTSKNIFKLQIAILNFYLLHILKANFKNSSKSSITTSLI
jgi:hypothetical protein